MVWTETMSDFMLIVGQLDCYFMVKLFYITLLYTFTWICIYTWLMIWADSLSDLILMVGPCEFHGPVILAKSQMPFYGSVLSYTLDNSFVWHCEWPHTNGSSVWFTFHDLVAIYLVAGWIRLIIHDGMVKRLKIGNYLPGSWVNKHLFTRLSDG